MQAGLNGAGHSEHCAPIQTNSETVAIGASSSARQSLQVSHEMLALRRVDRLLGRSCTLLGAVANTHSLDLPSDTPATVRQIVSSTSCRSPVHIEDELYCRQRQQVVLGNRIPYVSPDAWIAPNAVVIGDVDLFDKVKSGGSKPPSVRKQHMS